MKSDKEKNQTKSQGKLIGWLVSFEGEQRGSYYELHEGRTFVGHGVIQNERLVALDADDISTAQAVLNAVPSHPLMVQDLFSTSGTYITKSGSKNEVSVSGKVEVEHGDWLRFGEKRRFQLCLLDGGSK